MLKTKKNEEIQKNEKNKVVSKKSAGNLKSKFQKVIYLDNSATTKCDNSVIKEINYCNKIYYGNPSSLHIIGEIAKSELEKARLIIAKSINAETDEIIFTSGGTESNNTAIKSIALFLKNEKKTNRIISSKIEHPSVYEVFNWLKSFDFDTQFVSVDKFGFVDLEDLEYKLMEKETSIVSIIHANNEIGTIQNIEKISSLVHKYGALLHIDACQSYGKVNLDVQKLNADMITLNAHKLHGPKGIGALYISKNAKKYFRKWQNGGSQEFNLRGGTENLPNILGFKKAVENNVLDNSHNTKIKEIRNHLVKRILNEIKDSYLNGPDVFEKNSESKRLINNANISFKGVEGEAILLMLNKYNICVSTGSACSSKSLDPSHVLLAIGLSHEIAHSSIRFSLSKYNTIEEIDYTVEKLKEIITQLRKMSPFWKD